MKLFTMMKSAVLSIGRYIRSHYILSALAGFVLLLVVWGASALFSPSEPELITETSRRGDLRQTVEAVGEVISERDLKLQFPITGVIDRVLVKEGDVVEAGQELARLRSSGLAAEVDSARARVASAQAQLTELEEGTRPEDIAIAEAELANKRASLDAAKRSLQTAQENIKRSQQKLDALQREADTSLAGDVSDANVNIQQYLTKTLTDVSAIEDVFNYNDMREALIRESQGETNAVLSEANKNSQAITSALLATDANDYAQALSQLQNARSLISQASNTLSLAYNLVSSVSTTNALTTSEKETYKGTLETSKNSVQTSLSAISTSMNALRDAAATYDTRITTEETNLAAAENARDQSAAEVQTYETAVNISEAQLQLKRAGTRQTDIDAARASLNQAYADLRRAQDRYTDTIIRAPINGSITKVNLKEGELLSTAFASDTAISMLGESPYRIELFIAEIDIPKVAIGMSGSILLDAFPDQPFDLVVTEIDPAATIVDGVPKYRAKMDFVEQDDRMKIGMTGDAEILTDFREDVVIIPGRAVIKNADGAEVVRVVGPNQMITEKEVETGMEGEGGDTEVITGLKEGETIVILIRE